MESRNLIKLIAILVVVVGIGWIFSPFSATGDTTKTTDIGDAVKEINVKAFKFGYTPDEITVNKGEKIRLKIDNADVPHGIRIPSLGVKGENMVEFTADKEGEHTWYCLVPCGKGHMLMQGKLIVK